MHGLLVFNGMNTADAVAATVLIRIATLWFAVAIGVLMLMRLGGQNAARKAAVFK